MAQAGSRLGRILLARFSKFVFWVRTVFFSRACRHHLTSTSHAASGRRRSRRLHPSFTSCEICYEQCSSLGETTSCCVPDRVFPCRFGAHELRPCLLQIVREAVRMQTSSLFDKSAYFVFWRHLDRSLTMKVHRGHVLSIRCPVILHVCSCLC